MADTPTNPQQIIDKASEALGQTTPSDVQTPPVAPPPLMQTQPTVDPAVVETPLESLVIPPKGQKPEPPPPVENPPKKKGGKGIVIGILLFFILTLPVVIYYGTKQIAEIRSRATAVYRCTAKSGELPESCDGIACNAYNTSSALCVQHSQCCSWSVSDACSNTGTPFTCSGTCPEGKRCTVGGRDSCFCSSTASIPTITNTPTPPKTAEVITTTACTNTKAYAPSMSPVTCNYYSGSAISGQGTFQGQCAFYHCPLGCTDSCGESTPGYTLEFGACNSGKLGANECGQIDTVDQNNRYCAPTIGCDALIQCSKQGFNCSQKTVVTNTPVPTNTPIPTATNTPGPTSTTNTPGTCDASCDTDSNCESGLSCQTVSGVKRCRASACPNESSCSCPAATPTQTSFYNPTPTTVYVVTNTTPTEQPTPKVPVAGGLFDAKAIGITFISILFLTLGLIL